MSGAGAGTAGVRAPGADGRWNAAGARALFEKEVRRFGKVWVQTLVTPLVTTSLYFLVFGVALGPRLGAFEGVAYARFVVPGLVLMALVNASYQNTSSSLFQSKINGTIIDLLSAPLGASEILVAYVGAALVRALAVGALVLGVAAAFGQARMHAPLAALAVALAAGTAFACGGLATAILAEKFEHVSLVPTFVLAPLTYLGGVFFSLRALPPPWSSVGRWNPIFYMVDGLRWSMLGTSEAPPALSLAVVTVLAVAMCAFVGRLFARGHKLRT